MGPSEAADENRKIKKVLPEWKTRGQAPGRPGLRSHPFQQRMRFTAQIGRQLHLLIDDPLLKLLPVRVRERRLGKGPKERIRRRRKPAPDSKEGDQPTCPVNISNSRIPMLHQSASLLCPLESNISGAMYSVVPHMEFERSDSLISFASPKSVSITCTNDQSWTSTRDESHGGHRRKMVVGWGARFGPHVAVGVH